MEEMKDSLRNVYEVDIGYGRPLVLSSSYSTSKNVGLLVPARNAGGISFHTNLDDSPYALVDLQTVRSLSILRLYNDENTPERAVPLTISGSSDGQAWTDIANVSSIFGGRRTNTPFEIKFNNALRVRYVKIQCTQKTFFHLDYIEILTSFSSGPNGRFQNIREMEDKIEADYIHHDSHGFTWTFTNTLAAISSAVEAGVLVKRINYSLALQEFKDDPFLDLYPVLFATPNTADLPLNHHLPMIERHGIYVRENISGLKPYVDAYFTPALEIQSYAKYLIGKYNLDLTNTLVVIYRGTDKSIEVTPAGLQDYADAIKFAQNATGYKSILIQTDQTQALGFFKSRFPEALAFDEMPVTKGDKAIHNLDLSSEFALTKLEFAKRMLAVTFLCAQAAYVITHTGNIGAWVALYRGGPHQLYQFDQSGNLRDPSGNRVDL